MTVKFTRLGSIYGESVNACGKLVWAIHVYEYVSKNATLQCILFQVIMNLWVGQFGFWFSMG
jgi:hypothetical protein